MIVLVDTDVLIDLALDREPYVEPAGALLDALQQRAGSGFVTWHSMADFSNLMTPSRGRSATKQLVLDLLEFVDVAPTTSESLRHAALWI